MTPQLPDEVVVIHFQLQRMEGKLRQRSREVNLPRFYLVSRMCSLCSV